MSEKDKKKTHNVSLAAILLLFTLNKTSLLKPLPHSSFLYNISKYEINNELSRGKLAEPERAKRGLAIIWKIDFIKVLEQQRSMRRAYIIQMGENGVFRKHSGGI